ncbi:SGNH/GDSL hydrolase family protein [Bradyrhizobium erythrophlei]|nr:SGNH/GDSL hydrolase family protein [Bradyrhizobium erythrophlei]
MSWGAGYALLKSGVAAAFSPGSLTGVKYWLNAGSITGVADGGSVTAAKWVDGSLSVKGALASATGLIYRANGGQPAVEFDGTASVAVSPTVSIAANRRVFVVFKSLGVNGSGLNPHYIIDGAALNQGAINYSNSDIEYAGIGLDGGSVAQTVCIQQNKPSLIDAVFNGASSSLQVDGQTVQAGTSTASTYTAITIGAPGNQLAGYFTNIQVLELIVCDSTLTAPQATQIRTYLNSKYSLVTPKAIWCLGDSLTYGTNAVNPIGGYPSQLQAAYGMAASVLNYGVAGTTVAQIDANSATYNDLDPKYFTRSVYVGWGGTNDIQAGTSGATTHASLVTMFNNRRAAMPTEKLVVVTCMARGPFTGAQETERLALNTLIRANWATYANALVDVTTDARLQTPTNTTYFAGDTIHLTDAGYGVVMGMVKPVIDGFG